MRSKLGNIIPWMVKDFRGKLALATEDQAEKKSAAEKPAEK